MPPSRRHSGGRTAATHAEILTPGWRPYVSSGPAPDEDQSVSSDDTADEAYLSMHHPLALRERENWAGPKAGAKTEKKTGAKRTRPVKPMFPTPKECVEGVLNGWRSHYSQAQVPNRGVDTVIAKRRALSGLEPTVACLAGMEEHIEQQRLALQSAKSRMRDGRRPRRPINGRVDRRNGVLGEHAGSVMFQVPIDSRAPLTSGRNGVVSDPGMPSGAHGTVVPMTGDEIAFEMAEKTLRTMEEVQAIFQEKTRSLLDSLRSIARQGHCKVQDRASFGTLKNDLADMCEQDGAERRSGENSDDDGSTYSLSRCIRRQIDAASFPVLARTFRLRRGYRLDGTTVDDEDGARHNGVPYTLDRPEENKLSMNGHLRDIGDTGSGSDDHEDLYIDRPEYGWKSSAAAEPDRGRASPRFARSYRTQAKNEIAPMAGPQDVLRTPRSNGSNHGRERKERKSYRIVDDNVESITSGPSDPSQNQVRSFSRVQPSHHAQRREPARFQYVFDVDGNEALNCAAKKEPDDEDNGGSDYYPAVVDLDNDQ